MGKISVNSSSATPLCRPGAFGFGVVGQRFMVQRTKVATRGPTLPPGRPTVVQGEALSPALPMYSSCTSIMGELMGWSISMQA
jgi:hypothetical protein